METKEAISSLSSLAHEQRLAVFRVLVKAGPKGMIAGDIASRLDIRPNTLSNNLAILASAGMVRSTREGRAIRYHANMEGMRELLAFLLEDCCGGQPEQCQPVLDQISCKC